MSGYSREKEFIRDVFYSGELGFGDEKTFKRFLELFAGETEAVIAIQQSHMCNEDPKKMAEMVAIAKPNHEAIEGYERFHARAVHGVKPS